MVNFRTEHFLSTKSVEINSNSHQSITTYTVACLEKLDYVFFRNIKMQKENLANI